MTRTEDAVVLVRNSDGVRTLILHRPAQLNAFDQTLCGELTKALAAAQADNDIKVVLLTGAGRAFSAGTDLKELAESGDFRSAPDNPRAFDDMIDCVAEFSKPLLCAVNGLAVGLGVTLLGLADLVFMADDAQMKCPFTSLALVPEAGSSVTIPLLVGRQHATWLLLSSQWVDARAAAEMGLAWKVAAADEVLSIAMEHARELATQPLESLVASKRLIAETFADAVAIGRNRENAAFDRLLHTPESRSAVDAFVTRPKESKPGGIR
jgi:enoyl-CoA hydratase/carnithine racemase